MLGAIIGIELMKQLVKESDFSEYAFKTIIKGQDSQKQYIKDPYWP